VGGQRRPQRRPQRRRVDAASHTDAHLDCRRRRVLGAARQQSVGAQPRVEDAVARHDGTWRGGGERGERGGERGSRGARA